MNITITIQSPVLLAGQQFKIEWSSDGSTWTFDSYQTVNTFVTTYSGFTAGDTYYFRFTIVKSLSPLVECDAVTRVITLPEENAADCLDITASIAKFFLQKILNVGYTIPMGFQLPCGGFRLKHGSAYPLTVINYSTYPPNPITIPIGNATAYYVEFYSVDCDGEETLCYQELVVAPDPEACTPATLVDMYLTRIGGVPKLVVIITPSSPAAPTYTISYSEVYPINGIQDSGTVTVNATGSNPETFTLTINPSLGGGLSEYQGSITDGCTGTLVFSDIADL